MKAPAFLSKVAKGTRALADAARRQPALVRGAIAVAAAAIAYGIWVLLDSQLDPQNFKERRDFLVLYFGIIGGAVTGTGVYIAWRRLSVAQEGQITERFTRAVELLGSDKLEVRLGAIYALERIARDSEKDHWTIMEVLTGYVRERARWKEGTPDNIDAKPATDIQAALTVIGRRKEEWRKKETDSLDLQDTDLRGAIFNNAHLDEANFNRGHLEKTWFLDVHADGAYFFGANLDGANFFGAHLDRASFDGAHLDGSSFGGAHLDGSSFAGAHLDRASFSNARLDHATFSGAANFFGAWLDRAIFARAHLDGASFDGAHLDGVSFHEAYLDGARFDAARLDGARFAGAHLEGADLSRATGLTVEQINQAYLDDNTKLPDYLPKEQITGRQPGPTQP